MHAPDAASAMPDAAPEPHDAAMPALDAGMRDAAQVACDAAMPGPTGKSTDLRSGTTLSSALQMAQAGDRIVVHQGSYPHESISNCTFSTDVYIEGASGESPATFAGLDLHGCSHLTIRALHFSNTLMLEGAGYMTLRTLTLDPGTASEEAALHIQGQGSGGACHDITVEDSVLANGGRTIFILGRFAPAMEWNHDLRFARNEITCGSHVCFQLSGARDTVIEHNRLRGPAGSGVLTAGATRISVQQNRFEGGQGAAGAAVQIATPGMEWDNYDGVENMISSAITVANNLIDGWATGVQLDAARDIAVVFNTVPSTTGLRLNHRTPHDRSGNVILNATSDLRLWNNILAAVSIASGEARPSFESNNLVIGSGGGGTGLLNGTPGFVDATDYELTASSPAVGAALVNAETPNVDFDGRGRDDRPDLGARERGAQAAQSCR
jgi:hypothetical protein